MDADEMDADEMDADEMDADEMESRYAARVVLEWAVSAGTAGNGNGNAVTAFPSDDLVVWNIATKQQTGQTKKKKKKKKKNLQMQHIVFVLYQQDWNRNGHWQLDLVGLREEYWSTFLPRFWVLSHLLVRQGLFACLGDWG